MVVKNVSKKKKKKKLFEDSAVKAHNIVSFFFNRAVIFWFIDCENPFDTSKIQNIISSNEFDLK